ncbi:MAG: ATP-binding protein [Anaerolineaceae bacterium]|nr:MAG: ATP-binding protein [Anaerolineaceae bacterium]
MDSGERFEHEGVRSLTELIEKTSARRFIEAPPPEDLGLAEPIAFPFLSIVGQSEMKMALILSLINVNVGGVLLIGPRGTGKTTAVRSLIDLLPDVERSRCPYGCLPEDIVAGGIEEVCPDCARRYGMGEELTFQEQVRLIELPLNSRLEDVIGGIDERAAVHQRMRLNRGILARADRNLLFVDEVNLLDDDIVDAILDAAAQGTYTVHRGPLVATYRARFILVGSMNPEEGRLRPQILDRFGLRIIVRGLEHRKERLEAYHRTVAFRNNPRLVVKEFSEATELFRQELVSARELLPEVQLTSQAESFGLKLIQELGIDSLRAEITLFEAARAHAIADGRDRARVEDIRRVASMSLRMRRSTFMQDYLSSTDEEDEEILRLLKTSRKNSVAE